MQNIIDFPDSDQLAKKLAEEVARVVSNDLENKGFANIALSGGRTPKVFLGYLAKQKLSWAKIFITLVDERWVEPTHPRSNQLLIQEFLLDRTAVPANFVPHYVQHSQLEAAALNPTDAQKKILSEGFSAVVLGMGEDGHTASFFEDSPSFELAVDVNLTPCLVAVRSSLGIEPRITFSLSALLRSNFIAVQVVGKRKLDTLRKIFGRCSSKLDKCGIANLTNQKNKRIDFFCSEYSILDD